MNEPLLSLLGMARRAGRLTLGYEAAADSLRRRTAYLVLLASDLAERTERQLKFAAGESNVAVVRTKFTIEELSHAVGQRTGTVAICDEGFARRAAQLNT